MDGIDPKEHRRLDRRTFLKGGLLAGGAIAGAGVAIRAAAQTTSGGSADQPSPVARPAAKIRQTHPNILVIVVDQLRFPQWFSPNPAGLGLPPNLQRLRQGAVSFARHYSASNDCSPARSTLLTGLYTHQTGCMITGGSTLDPGFPTWGTMLREHGYRTRWLGKWHLTHGDNHWTELTGEQALERYGFDGGVFPSPDGAPGQGWRVDPHIAARFSDWFALEGALEPWCTTVSFVNPHDIAWWYKWTDRVAPETFAKPVINRLAPNYETPELLLERHKPRLQRSFQETAAASFGPVPFAGPEYVERWLSFLDLYMKLQLEVDRHIGHVISTLESQPEVAANTVIVFTSDHGEYGGSHGLRGKGASAYEEAIRVPLLVKDPRGILTAAPEVQRTQLTSSVDVAPLLLTIATGSDDWRHDSHYSYLADRADLAGILADPATAGRPYVLHATDETVTEFAIEPYAADAPLHIVAMRTPQAKYAIYSNWPETGITPLAQGQEVELYDYSTQTGRLELHNSAGQSPLEESLLEQLELAVRRELRGPLPPRLVEAHARGFADYFSTARHAAVTAAARRKRRAEHESEPLQQEVPGATLFRRRRTL
ncbi:MAG TPA: sulfatase-like hydrolase/transferase [Solirubrobacteraceae bacterium]|jgi:arylsulfatase A-like enzyme|nr:sulfatase-like hydrolase/transferase [Solirubrobacteraceae bacterium]